MSQNYYCCNVLHEFTHPLIILWKISSWQMASAQSVLGLSGEWLGLGHAPGDWSESSPTSDVALNCLESAGRSACSMINTTMPLRYSLELFLSWSRQCWTLDRITCLFLFLIHLLASDHSVTHVNFELHMSCTSVTALNCQTHVCSSHLVWQLRLVCSL
jgi:hypothetical protein